MSTETEPATHVECKCDLVLRQAKVDSDAAIVGKEGKRIWHATWCPVAMMIELRRIEHDLLTLDDQPMLPDPVIERLASGKRDDLTARRTQLRNRLKLKG